MVQDKEAAMRDEDCAIFIDDRAEENARPDRARLSDEEMKDLLSRLSAKRPDLFGSR